MCFILFLCVFDRGQRGNCKFVWHAKVADGSNDKVRATPRSFGASGVSFTDANAISSLFASFDVSVGDSSRRSQELDGFN